MTRWILVTLVAFAMACGGEGEKPADKPKEKPVEKPMAAKPTEPEKPKAAGCVVPDGDLVGAAAAGKSVYATYCATCHGAKGKGDGPAAPKDPPPADHSNAEYMASLSDQHLYKVIACGGASIGKSPMMTAWGGILSEQQIKDVIARTRELSAPES